MRKTYNERIRELREDHDYTQAYIAEILHCSIYTYQRYEYGTQLLPIDKLILLTELYHVSADYILGLTNHTAPSK